MTHPEAGYPSVGATTVGQPDVAAVSVGQLVGEVTSDLSQLMRQELELAKAELRHEAVKTGKAAGMLGAAGFAGYLLVLFLSLTLMFAFAALIGHGTAGHAWAALIVTLLWGIVAAILYTKGRAKWKTVSPKPEQTVETLKEDAEWAKTRTR